MNRRTILEGAAALAATALTRSAQAADHPNEDESNHMSHPHNHVRASLDTPVAEFHLVEERTEKGNTKYTLNVELTVGVVLRDE